MRCKQLTPEKVIGLSRQAEESPMASVATTAKRAT